LSPKDEVSTNRKEQIMQSAAGLFAAQGYYKTTTAHVAEAVGVTQPYVFHFFKSKELLYLAVLERAYDRMVRVFNQVEAPPERLCAAMGDAFSELLMTHRNEMLLLMQCSSAPEPNIKEFANKRFAQIHEMAKNRFTEEGIPNASHEATLFIAKGLIISLSAVLELPQLNL